MEERETALHIAAAAEETKAEAILLYDLENRSPITDYVLICSGRSQAHVRGICDRIEVRLKELGVRPSTIEGYQEGSWALLDYSVVIVHVFHPETRLYYNLEALLAQYPREEFPPPAPVSAAAPDEGATPS